MHCGIKGCSALWLNAVHFDFRRNRKQTAVTNIIHRLGYQNDNSAAAHSVDIYVFYAVIHLHLHYA